MNILSSFFVFLLGSFLGVSSSSSYASESEQGEKAPLYLLPEPQSVTYEEGTCPLSALNQVKERPWAKSDKNPAPAAYELKISPSGVVLFFGDEAGLLAGRTTLLQLKEIATLLGRKSLPALSIEDKPSYGWRGLMLDPARHYLPIKDIKTFIDSMAYYKFNKLHLHLVDDQGWRLPVPGYPKLTEISAWRAETEGNGKPHGGFYTKKELKELVAYAAQKGIEILPEIDMPGHSQALAAAYPELICFPKKDIKVGTTPGVTKELVCVGKPEAKAFYEAVLKEVADIFPSRLVHLGGDEAPRDNWEKCAQCAEWRKTHKLADTKQQMGFFFKEREKFLSSLGKEALFWYEEGEGSYPKGSTVYTWRMGRTPQVLENAQKDGLKVIAAPGEHAYFDYPQHRKDTHSMGPLLPLKKAYHWDPAYGRTAENNPVIGVEGTLWGERIENLERLFFATYPRALAMSEVAWTPQEKRSWELFQEKAEVHARLLKKKWNMDPYLGSPEGPQSEGK